MFSSWKHQSFRSLGAKVFAQLRVEAYLGASPKFSRNYQNKQ